MIKMDNYRVAAYIDLRILEENYKTIKAQLPPNVKMLCVVKADAYGHGMIEVAGKLQTIGADYLGVATISEGIALRSDGIHIPVLVMSGILPWDDIKPVLHNSLSLVVYDIDTLKKIADACILQDKGINVHLKIDTGMGRLGFSLDDVPAVIKELKDSRYINIEGIMSHFSMSEIRDEYGLQQVKAFKNILQIFQYYDIRPELIQMANSGAIINYPEAHFNMVRAGIFTAPIRQLN